MPMPSKLKLSLSDEGVAKAMSNVAVGQSVDVQITARLDGVANNMADMTILSAAVQPPGEEDSESEGAAGESESSGTMQGVADFGTIAQP